jgi:hypothetical protein
MTLLGGELHFAGGYDSRNQIGRSFRRTTAGASFVTESADFAM